MVVNMVKSNKIIFHLVIHVLVVVEVFHLINYHDRDRVANQLKKTLDRH